MAVVAPGPTITTSGTLSTFTACADYNSAEQSFSVSGNNLTNDIDITAPLGYEVSFSSGSGFATSIILDVNGGILNSTTIYVRTITLAADGDGGDISLKVEHDSKRGYWSCSCNLTAQCRYT